MILQDRVITTTSLIQARPVGEEMSATPPGNTERAEASTPVTTAQAPPASHGLEDTAIDTFTSIIHRQLSPTDAHSKPQNDLRRDSGLAPSSSTTRGSHTTFETDLDSSPSLRHSPSLPSSTCEDARHPTTQKKPKRWAIKARRQKAEDDKLPPVPQLPFLTLNTQIPTSSIEDLTSPGRMQFSQRGSMLISGRKANQADGKEFGGPHIIGQGRKPSTTKISPSVIIPSRALSADEEILSLQVRAMYDSESDEQLHREFGSTDGGLATALDQHQGHSSSKLPTIVGSPVEPESSTRSTVIKCLPNKTPLDDVELAGKIENWEDVHGGDVDRYGFIVQQRLPSRGSTLHSQRAISPKPARLQRTSTALQVASEVPRRQRSKIGRATSSKTPARSAKAPVTSRPNSRFDRPASSQSSYQGSLSATQSKIRSATNRLPHNKGRRFVDEAGDMLTLPPGLADIAENNERVKVAEAAKRQEWQREEKWRRMAKIVESSRDGGGMVFEFDTTSSKLIERTWKGIPDRWRATAWHAFLTASAKKRRVAHSDDELISIFQQLVKRGSPDDFQIDLDVPRTISSHIMFRKRYRGGQRLLFRVLHCMSIYFPNTGYVQGMAALAATLLCYFDEEMTFVMLVRLWQLRGLERLYEAGFEGLMNALEEFEHSWLAGGEVSTRLVRSGILYYLSANVLIFSRLSLELLLRLTALVGTSRYSTTQFLFLHSCVFGMSSCFLGILMLEPHHQPLPTSLTPCSVEASMFFTPRPQPSSMEQGRYFWTLISRTP